MKSLLILTALLFLASCGNNKLRFKKVSLFDKQEIVSLDGKQNSERKDRITTYEAETSSAATSVLGENSSAESVDFGAEETKGESVSNPEEGIQVTERSIAPSDTLKVNEGETEENKAIAKKAENISTVGVWLNRGVLIVLILSGVLAIALLGWEPLLAGAIVGFIMGVTAIILGFISKGKSHNTELGRRQSSKAIIGGFILSFILGFILFLTAGAL